MKKKEALKVIAEAIKNNTIKDLKKDLIKPLKKAYGVEDLVFWKDTSNWFYCDFKFPNPNLWHNSNYEKDNLDDLLGHLKWLSEGNGVIFFQGQRYENLFDLKQEVLIRKLSGIV